MRLSVMTCLVSVALLSGCGGGADQSAAQLSALAQQGQKVFSQCAACHTINAGEPHRSGPNLNGVMGAEIGPRDGYKYSPALANAEGVWTDERLSAWLQNPKSDFAGHKMAFGGLASADDRAAVIAYLKEAGGAQPNAAASGPTE